MAGTFEKQLKDVPGTSQFEDEQIRKQKKRNRLTFNRIRFERELFRGGRSVLGGASNALRSILGG